MSQRLTLIAVAFLALLPTTAQPASSKDKKPAEEKKSSSAAKTAPAANPLQTANTDALAGSIRGFLVRYLPKTLHEDSRNWGHTSRAPSRLRWVGKGLDAHVEMVYTQKNDGKWQKIRVTAEDLADTLIFDIRKVRKVDEERLRFDVFVSFDAEVYCHQQNWESGLKLYDGTARARLRVKLNLTCEATTRVEQGKDLLGKLVPDVVFRLRVIKSDLQYDNFVLQHISGIGGEFAQLLGEAFKGALREWNPGLERELLAKANDAIVKSADTKDVRLSLGSLFGK